MEKARPWLWVALAGAVVLWLGSRTKKGEEVVAAVTEAVVSTVRGIRNNNPGNIELTGDQWTGPRLDQPDSWGGYSWAFRPWGRA